MGDKRPAIRVFRHLAAGHRNDHRHVPDGVPHSEFADRDSAAIQVKLDELIRVGAARNSMVGIEHLTDDELEDLRGKCEARAHAEKAADKTVEKTRKSARRAADKVAN
jgi:hypothetical protein